MQKFKCQPILGIPLKLLALLFLLPQFLLRSQTDNGFQALLTHENDFLFINNDDENYTGGLNLELTMTRWNVWQPFYKLSEDFNFQKLSIGGTGYTPQNLTSETVVFWDRPYASLTYLSIGLLSQNETKNASLISKLYLGLVGSSGPGKVQYFLHDRHVFGTTRPNPQGWDNQIGFDGSFVLNYNVRYMKDLSNGNYEEKAITIFKSYWTSGFDLGNYMISAQTGLYLDLFNINAFPVFGVDNSPIPVMVSTDDSFLTEGFFYQKKAPTFRFNIFAKPFVRLVGHNTTLEGLLFNDGSAYKIEGGNVNRLVFEFSGGINMVVNDNFYLRYVIFMRSREFSEGKSIHYWGGLTLGFSPKGWFGPSN